MRAPVVLTLAIPARQFIALAIAAADRGTPMDDHVRAILAAAAPPLPADPAFAAAEAGGDVAAHVDVATQGVGSGADGDDVADRVGRRVVDQGVVDHVACSGA